MRTAVSTLELRQPRSLRDALVMLEEEPGLIPLAGATDLFVALNDGTLPGRRFLDLWGLSALRRISLRDDVLSIGALATFTSIARSRAVRARAPMLAAAALQVGGIQIQNRATIGGNIANGSPAGDSLPVLSALDAQVVLASVDDERRVRFAEYFTGYRKSVRVASELIIAVEIDTLEGKQWFRKVGTRAAQAISKVVIAGVRAPRPRLAIGSAGPTVFRLTRVEEALAAGHSVDEAVEILQREISPIDDLRSSAAYRRRVAGNLLRRFWEDTSK
ncbi:MAG TPA: FAD binding domain-containing protein [Gemmatimonadales bacterium]|nr:FAD binding domain-containing protein [Gemmatimonadales bacterium]